MTPARAHRTEGSGPFRGGVVGRGDRAGGEPGSAPCSTATGRPACCPDLYSSSAAVLAAQALTRSLFARLGVPEVARHDLRGDRRPGLGRHLRRHARRPIRWTSSTSRLVVVWGANPTVANTHLLPLLTEAKANGARLVVIDPRRTAWPTAPIFTSPCVRAPTSCSPSPWPACWRSGARWTSRSAPTTRGVDEYLAAAAAGRSPGRRTCVAWRRRRSRSWPSSSPPSAPPCCASLGPGAQPQRGLLVPRRSSGCGCWRDTSASGAPGSSPASAAGRRCAPSGCRSGPRPRWPARST